MPFDEEEASRREAEESPGPSVLESALANDTLADVVTQPALILDGATMLADAIRTMREEKRACVLVIESQKLAGVFTERDILMKVAATSVDVNNTRLDQVMTRDPVTLPADSNVAYALNLMVLEGFRHIPIVDDDELPVAVVSMRNLIEYLGSFYSRDLLTIAPHPRLSRFKNRDGA
jgi:CBS domain-containing protein